MMSDTIKLGKGKIIVLMIPDIKQKEEKNTLQ